MKQYIDTLQDVNGNALVGAAVLVQNYIGGANASIFSDDGLTPILTSTVATGADGQFSFFAADGDYNLVMSKNATVFKTQSPVNLFDSAAQLTYPDVGAVNAYATTNSALEKALRAGLRAYFNAAHTNTGASTFAYNTLAAKNIVQPGGFALAAGAINVGGIYMIEYDGVNWQLLTEPGSAIFYQVTAAETTAGVVPTNFNFPTLSVDRYGTNTVPGTTDMSAAFTKAVHVAQINGGTVTYGATGQYLLAAAVNCTFGTNGNQKGVIIQGPDGGLDGGPNGPAFFPIVAKHTQSAIFDCTGNDSIKFRDVSMTTDPVTFPRTGILVARNNTGAGSVFREDNVKYVGHFSVAPLYIYGGEDDVHVGCYYQNFATTANTKSVAITANNVSGLASAFAADNFGNAVTIAAGLLSTTEHNFFGCEYLNQGGQATSDCIYLEQADAFRSYGGYAFSGNGATSGRAAIFVDMSNAASSLGHIDSLQMDNQTHQSQYVLAFSNNIPAGPPTGWAFTNVRSACTTSTIVSLSGAGVIDGLNVQNLTELASRGISIPGTLQNSTIQGSNVNVTVGTSTNNNFQIIAGNLAITTTNGGSKMHTGAALTFAPGIVTGVNGWTLVGALTQRARYTYIGNMVSFQMLLAGGTTLASAAGATIPTLPVAAIDDMLGTVCDETSGAVTACKISGTTITIPAAIGATAHEILISGTYFVS